MPTHVGGPLEPRPGLLVEILVVDELPAVEEALADVADRPLHLTLRSGAVRPARPHPESPVGGEAQEVRVQYQLATARAAVRQHHRTHLVEQQLPRHPAEPPEGALQPLDQHLHRLPLVEPQPQQTRVAQHRHQRMPPPPRQFERRKVHLPLPPRRRLETHHRFLSLPRPHRPNVVPHSHVPARVTRSPNLVVQPLRRQPRELLQALLDDPLVRVQLVTHRRPRPVPRPPSLKVPVQLPRLDPLVDRPATHPEPPRQLRLRHSPFQIVLQKHPCLPSVHPCSAPFLLVFPTAWSGALQRTINVCSFRLPLMGDLQLPAT